MPFRYLKRVGTCRHDPVLFEIILLQWLLGSVNINLCIPDLHRFARQSDHTLYIRLLLIIRILEYDHVPTLRSVLDIGKTVADQTVPRHNRIFHGARRHMHVDDQAVFDKKRCENCCHKIEYPA